MAFQKHRLKKNICHFIHLTGRNYNFWFYADVSIIWFAFTGLKMSQRQSWLKRNLSFSVNVQTLCRVADCCYNASRSAGNSRSSVRPEVHPGDCCHGKKLCRFSRGLPVFCTAKGKVIGNADWRRVRETGGRNFPNWNPTHSVPGTLPHRRQPAPQLQEYGCWLTDWVFLRAFRHLNAPLRWWSRAASITSKVERSITAASCRFFYWVLWACWASWGRPLWVHQRSWLEGSPVQKKKQLLLISEEYASGVRSRYIHAFIFWYLRQSQSQGERSHQQEMGLDPQHCSVGASHRVD